MLVISATLKADTRGSTTVQDHPGQSYLRNKIKKNGKVGCGPRGRELA
jgi:hypothetical protein